MVFKNRIFNLQNQVSATSERLLALEAYATTLQSEVSNINQDLSGIAATDANFKMFVERSMAGYNVEGIDLIGALERRMGLFQSRMFALNSLIDSYQSMIANSISHLEMPRTPSNKPAVDWAALTEEDRSLIGAFLLQWDLFDPNWYTTQYLSASNAGQTEPFIHFLNIGIMEGFDPHPLFSNWYLSEDRNFPKNAPPITIFAKGLTTADPFPLFDSSFYISRYPDVNGAGMHPFLHFIKYGAAEGRQPHISFDPEWYNASRRSTADTQPLVDYITNTSSFRISPHPLFDSNHYLRLVPNLIETVANPLLHYTLWGEKHGLSPHPLFDPSFYLNKNPDLLAAGVKPLEHFLNYGDRELRQPHPLFVPSFYVNEARRHFAAIKEPLVHYIKYGWHLQVPTSPDLNLNDLQEALIAKENRALEPIASLMLGKDFTSKINLDQLIDTHYKMRSSFEEEKYASTIKSLRSHFNGVYESDSIETLEALTRIILQSRGGQQGIDRHETTLDLLSDVKKELSRFDDSGNSIISIIIPAHGNIIYTIACIKSILTWPPSCPFEILVAGDCRADAGALLIRSLGGIVRLIDTESHKGFVASCNMVADKAASPYLLFLNSGTIVLPESISALLELAQSENRTAIVGPKLLNLDGSLQEAGAICWNDGSTCKFGRGADPQAPPYNYVREVDYVSHAALFIRGEVWREAGGFDDIYSLGHYADADLAFKVRSRGHTVSYHPASQFIHLEDVVHGRELSPSAKEQYTENSKKFYGRWATSLLRDNFPPGQQIFAARDRSRLRPHLLMIDHYVPQWDQDAGSRTIFDFIKIFLARGFHITFWTDCLHRDPVYTNCLQNLGVEVIYGPEYAGRFEEWFSERAVWFPYVLLSRPHVSIHYIEKIKSSSSSKILYYGHDLHWKRLASENQVRKIPTLENEIEETRDLEYKLAAMSDVVLYPTEEESSIVRHAFNGTRAVITVPAWFFSMSDLQAVKDGQQLGAPEGRPRFIFVGGFAHRPNVDAIHWFVSEIMPELKAREFEFDLIIVGSNPPDDIKALADRDIKVAGRVTDEELTLLYARSSVAIVPLRFGGGIKGKVIEAFARGIAVVSTSIGLQGIEVGDEIAFRADDAVRFAESLMDAIANDAVRHAKICAAAEYLMQNYTLENFSSCLSGFVPELR